ncbi:MAG: Cytidine deaminase [Ignavibacteria bacterium]|nr:Cytidine deaminase [Ignavibacteria bacterium]
MHSKYSRLIKLSISAKSKSYSPYSKFKVGAALLTAGNKVYTGANIENASFSLCVCAERVVFSKAISEGEKKFKAIAISTGNSKPVFPCGACRQFMYEFCDDLDIIIVNSEKKFVITKLSELLPKGFNRKNLHGKK